MMIGRRHSVQIFEWASRKFERLDHSTTHLHDPTNLAASVGWNAWFPFLMFFSPLWPHSSKIHFLVIIIISLRGIPSVVTKQKHNDNLPPCRRRRRGLWAPHRQDDTFGSDVFIIVVIEQARRSWTKSQVIKFRHDIWRCQRAYVMSWWPSTSSIVVSTVVD